MRPQFEAAGPIGGGGDVWTDDGDNTITSFRFLFPVPDEGMTRVNAPGRNATSTFPIMEKPASNGKAKTAKRGRVRLPLRLTLRLPFRVTPESPARLPRRDPAARRDISFFLAASCFWRPRVPSASVRPDVRHPCAAMCGETRGSAQAATKRFQSDKTLPKRSVPLRITRRGAHRIVPCTASLHPVLYGAQRNQSGVRVNRNRPSPTRLGITTGVTGVSASPRRLQPSMITLKPISRAMCRISCRWSP